MTAQKRVKSASGGGSSPLLDAALVEDGPIERPRVLIVDDDERNLLALKTVVEEVADAVVASSGEEALRHLLKGEFAVILLDVFMPGIDGYETAKIIRSRDQTKRIPIVFLSAVNKESAHLMRGYEMGAVDYVFKPVEPVVLKSKVAVFVDLFAKSKEIQRKADQEQKLLDANLKANAERLRIEKELRLAQQRQQAIIESLPIVLYLEPLNASPRIPQFVSGNFEAVTGYSFEEVKENPNIWADRLHEEDRPRVMAALEARQRTGMFSEEYRWLCGSGEYKHFLDQTVLLKDTNGNPVEFAGTLMDVTDRKQLENQLVHSQKMDAVGKLTGGIAHDFNNLLAAVLGGLGMIERRVELKEDQKKILSMTRHAAEQGSELVKRLLAFARRQQLEPARVEIGKLSAAVGELLAHTLGGLVHLEWETDETLWPAFADEAQLELALMNLIINARDAMPEGGTITVSGRNESLSADNAMALPDGDYLVLTVADTGSGIPPEIVERVLEPFFTTKEVGKGTGLGLSMVYGFAKQSDGALRIDSKVGEGTRVEIWLPRAPDVQVRKASGNNASPATEEIARPKLRVLLADDHPGVRATTAAMLQDAGHTVLQASGGAEVLALLDEDPICCDIIVSDYAMPVLSGVEVVRRAREVRPGLPSIIITGYADTDSISNRPADVIVLAKPFTPDQLNNAVCIAHARGTDAAPAKKVAVGG
ncbi:MAG TPA: response regulator [Allosphingosinicella sp.]|uniref:response regulator n=1 Tax=Allosphingosinicella sp. TaxID=2823234 RepID=UPI002EDB696E